MKKLRYIFSTVVLLLCMCRLSVHKAEAQFVVTDPGNTASNIYNGVTATADAFSQLVAMFDQFELSEKQMESLKEFKDKMVKWNSDIQEAKDFLTQIRDFGILVKMMNSQVEMLTYYANAIKSAGQDQFSPYYLSNILNYATNTGYAIQALMDTINTIIKEVGIDKAQKGELIQQQVDDCARKIKHIQTFVIDEMQFMQDISEIVALDNFFTGRPPTAGLSNIGTETSGPASVSDNTQSLPQAESLEQVRGHSKRAGGTIYNIILVIIGISCLGSLIFAFAKYSRGEFGSEVMFARIFAVVIIVLIIFTTISKIVFK